MVLKRLGKGIAEAWAPDIEAMPAKAKAASDPAGGRVFLMKDEKYRKPSVWIRHLRFAMKPFALSA